MAKGKLVFSSVYALNVWDVQILNKDKKNMHSCGLYTVITINNLTRKTMRKESKNAALPILKDSMDSCLKTYSTIKDNQLLIDALYKDVCMSKQALFDLAKSSSNDSKWLLDKAVSYEKTPLSMLFANSFALFEKQCLEIDALAITGWIENKKSHALHKRLCKPLRNFMQSLSTNAKTLQ